MAASYMNGFDGAITLPSGHAAQINVWTADITRHVSDVTGFADTGKRRIVGMWDVQGSASGSPTYNDTAMGPGVNATDWARSGAAITLQAATGCTIAFTAVISKIGFNVNKSQDSAITFDFMLAGGALPTETWDETA